jgi:hypothetical protein
MNTSGNQSRSCWRRVPARVWVIAVVVILFLVLIVGDHTGLFNLGGLIKGLGLHHGG